MFTLNFAYPLQWPNGYPRTQVWDKSINQSFKIGLTIQEALTFLYEELSLLSAKKATLYSDYEHLEKPHNIRRVGNDNGVCLHMELNGRAYRIACDRWVPVEQNIYALHLALRNLRSIVLWGVGNIENVFGGYAIGVSTASAPLATNGVSAANGLEDWRLTLGLGPTATIEDAQAVYRRRAKICASDEQALMELNLAMDAAAQALG